MLPLPPLAFTSSATSAINQAGAAFSVDRGDWNVNLGGSGGAAAQSTTAAGFPGWLLPLVVLGGAWLLLHKKV